MAFANNKILSRKILFLPGSSAARRRLRRLPPPRLVAAGRLPFGLRRLLSERGKNVAVFSQAAARHAGAVLLEAAIGEASPARLLAAAGGWLAACAAALRAEEDAAVQRAVWRALAALFKRLGALAGAPGARREGAALVGRLMPVALPLLAVPPSAPPSVSYVSQKSISFAACGTHARSPGTAGGANIARKYAVVLHIAFDSCSGLCGCHH